MKTLIIFLLVFSPFIQTSAQHLQQRKEGNPLNHLPDNIEILTHFGERADFSPDNKRVAFMSKSFGDAMTIDLKTRTIECLTCNVPSANFLRVMHLSTGDYILIGPDKFKDIHTSRLRHSDLWFLSKKPGSKPEKLGVKVYEAAAISKVKGSTKIAYSQGHDQNPNLTPGSWRIVVANVDLSGGGATIGAKRVVYKTPAPKCKGGVEPQDFYDNDTKLITQCFVHGSDGELKSRYVLGIDLETGQVTNHSKYKKETNEPEGIFPGGKYTSLEGRHQCKWLGQKGCSMDIWKLKLHGVGKKLVRLTHFNDYKGGKAANSVVATNGKYMAFHVAKTGEPGGVGYGILLYKFK